MKRRYYRNIGAEIAVFADRNLCIVLTGKIEIEKSIFSYFRMNTVVKADRTVKRYAFIQFSEQLAENFFSFLLLILGQRIVLLVRLTGLEPVSVLTGWFSLMPR